MKSLGLYLLICLPTFATVVGWYNGVPRVLGAPAIRSQYVVNFPETCGTQSQCLYGVYDDFVVPASGWIVTGVLSHNTMNFSNVTQAYWEIRSGVSVGKPGTLVASGTSPAAQMPPLPPGDYPLQITIGSTSSNQPLLTIK